MSNFVILVDAASNVNSEIKERFEIDDVVKGGLNFPDGTYHDVTSDFDVISQVNFYEQLKNKKNKFTTSAPSPEVFESVFKKYLKEGKDVMLFTLSSALSSSYQYALVAANELNQKYDNKVVVIDSLAYSASELLLVIQASNLRKQGLSIDEVSNKIEDLKKHLHQAGPMDDLMFLARNGRISNGKAFMGTLVGVNPIGEVDKSGLTKVLCKVKGSKKALKVSLEYIKQTIINPSEQIVIVANSNRKEKADMFIKMIQEEINPKEIISVDVGLFCAPNIGPGLCAAYYLGKEKSEDLSKETAVFANIISTLK